MLLNLTTAIKPGASQPVLPGGRKDTLEKYWLKKAMHKKISGLLLVLERGVVQLMTHIPKSTHEVIYPDLIGITDRS
jgi:hypothetical protein